MESVRFAVIGVAGIAGAHYGPVLARKGVELVGLVDASEKNLASASERHPEAVATADVDEMLAKAKPDLVSVCTPNKWHCEYTLKALKAGAHVICEKPMAMNLAEAESMEAERAKAGKLGYINFSYRNIASFRFARELIRRGELGRIQRVQGLYLQSWLGSKASGFSWRNDKAIAGSGTLGDLGVHMIDAVRFITGLEFDRVVGIHRTTVPTRKDGEGREREVTTDTNASFLAEFDGGAVGTFETTQTAPGYGNYHRIEVSGDRGTLIVISDKGNEIQMTVGESLSKFATWTTGHPVHQVPTEFLAQQRADGPGLLVDAIRGEDVDYPTFADGVRAQAVLEAILNSNDGGSWVSTRVG
jgi:predicted dehydrogenase